MIRHITRRIALFLRSRLEPISEFPVNAEGVAPYAQPSAIRKWTCSCGAEFDDDEFEAHLAAHFWQMVKAEDSES